MTVIIEHFDGKDRTRETSGQRDMLSLPILVKELVVSKKEGGFLTSLFNQYDDFTNDRISLRSLFFFHMSCSLMQSEKGKGMIESVVLFSLFLSFFPVPHSSLNEGALDGFLVMEKK